jgi:hypothetical protein
MDPQQVVHFLERQLGRPLTEAEINTIGLRGATADWPAAGRDPGGMADIGPVGEDFREAYVELLQSGLPPAAGIHRDQAIHQSGSERKEGILLDRELQVVATRIDNEEPLTEGQQSLAEEYRSEITRILDEIAAREAIGTYDWVYNTLQLRPGSLDADEALVQLWEHLAQLRIVDPLDEPEDKALAVKELLARSPQNQAVQLAVFDWGQETGAYLPDQRVDGVPLREINAIAQRYGVTTARATTIGRLATERGVNPIELADVWYSQIKYLVPEASGAVRGGLAPITQVADSYKEGLNRYDQSQVLAAVHVFDPKLAAKLRSDPYSLDSGELQRVLKYADGAASQDGNPQITWIQQRLAGGYKVTDTVDTVAVREAIQTMADAWNLTGSEGIAASIAGELISAAVARARSQLPNPFGGIGDSPITIQDTMHDVSAHVRSRLREMPEYADLFAGMAPGESEEEYVSRFENRSQSVFGDDVPGAVRAGMRSGNVNTVYQQGLLTEAGEDSTRFQEIIARNARIFRELL